MEFDEQAFCCHSPLAPPFHIEGLAFFSEDAAYRRLPLSTREMFARVNPNLNELAEDPAGGCVRFRTDARRIAVRAEIGFPHDMPNMPAIAQCGFDLYAKLPGFYEYRFFGVAHYDIQLTEYAAEFALPAYEGEAEILLNLPLYCPLKRLEVGVACGAYVNSPAVRQRGGRLVFYGTSITQGGCASRPGMAYPAQLSRRLDMEAINLGFSANGLGEYEVAEVIGTIRDTRLIVLDYEANAGTNGRLEASLAGFIRTLRRALPNVPVLVLSRVPYAGDFYDNKTRELRDRLREFQRQTVLKLGGEKNKLYFYNGYDLFPPDFFDFTVDYIHPSDLGLKFIADGLYHVILEILRSETYEM